MPPKTSSGRRREKTKDEVADKVSSLRFYISPLYRPGPGNANGESITECDVEQ